LSSGTGGCPPGAKQGHEAEWWSYTSTPPYAFVDLCSVIEDRNNFILSRTPQLHLGFEVDSCIFELNTFFYYCVGILFLQTFKIQELDFYKV
jgi:hypothetical protein